MDSPFGRAVFAVARELYLRFQQGAVAPDYPPAFGDRSGTSLGWHLRLPGLDVVAPDLRSERRRNRVMGDSGWQMLRAALDRKSVVEGKSVSGRVDLGGRRIINKKKTPTHNISISRTQTMK